MIQRLQKYLELFNIKSGPLMGIWTLLMIVLTAIGRPIDSGAVTAYLGVIAVYGGSKAHSAWLETKSTPAKPGEEKESD